LTPVNISDAEVAAYQRDGAILLRGVLGGEWVQNLADAIEDLRDNPGPLSSRFTNTDGQGETFTDQFASVRSRALSQLIENSSLCEVAARLMKSAYAGFVLDQVFYKRAGVNIATPFHQDTPYFQVTGQDLARTWVCCDSSPPDVTVAVVRGSHRWNVLYSTNSLAISDLSEVKLDNNFEYLGNHPNESLPWLPDVAKHRDSFDILTWQVEPGDVLVFDGNVLHGTFGAADAGPRRALAVMWGGDNTRYMHRPDMAIPDLASLRGQSIASGELIRQRPDIFYPSASFEVETSSSQGA
jgi:ectoine hydroxylase-related dioxygenase (phytanoyl-CoA dioxygenase family)